jgi:hypothetical protein
MNIVLGLHTEPDPGVSCCMLEVDSGTLQFELEVAIDED